MNRWSTRDLVTLAVFGALWGAAEISLGSVLHALHLPLTGLVTGAVGMVIALTGYCFVPRRGAVLVIGVVSALLKIFSIGSTVLGPMLAIVMEALVAELGLALAGGKPRRFVLVLAGGLGVLWSFVHPFVTLGLFGGRGMFAVIQRVVENGVRLFGLDPHAVVLIVLITAALHLLVGLAAGALAYDLGRQLAHRLHPRAE